MEVRGHVCEEAEDGLDAVSMVQTNINSHNIIVYDVIFMDFMMPKMNGPDATRAIRQLGYNGPIIGLTGNALAEDKALLMNAGATDVIVKPFRIALLQKIIDS